MASPQAGIFDEASTGHHFLEYSVEPGESREELCRAVGEALSGVGDLAGRAQPDLVIAFGPA